MKKLFLGYIPLETREAMIGILREYGNVRADYASTIVKEIEALMAEHNWPINHRMIKYAYYRVIDAKATTETIAREIERRL